MNARPVNSSTIEVSWDPPIDKDKNGVIRGYQIHVQPKNMVCVLDPDHLGFSWQLIRFSIRASDLMAIVVLMYGGTYIAVTGSIPVANAISVYGPVFTNQYIQDCFYIIIIVL